MYQKYKYPIALVCSQALCALAGTILMRFHHSLFLFAYILAPIVVLEVICEFYKWHYAFWMKFVTYFVFAVCFILFWGDPNISRYIEFGAFTIPKALLCLGLGTGFALVGRKPLPLLPKAEDKSLQEGMNQSAGMSLFFFIVPVFVSVFFFNSILGLLLTLALCALAGYCAVFFAKRAFKKQLAKRKAVL